MSRLAVAYCSQERWFEGLTLAQTLLREFPNDVDGHAIAGRALLRLGKPAESAREIGAALRISPGDPDLEYSRAEALLLLRNPADEAEARRLLEDSLKRGRSSALVYYYLGDLYQHQHAWEKAANAFWAAYKIGHNTSRTLKKAAECYFKAGMPEEGHYVRGLYLESINDLDGAARAYHGLTRKHAYCQAGYLHVARAQVRAQQYTAALATLQKAKSAMNAGGPVYAELAHVYGALKKLKERDNAWLSVARIDPENADVAYQNLGAISDRAGLLDEAEKYYRKSVQLAPNADLYHLRLAELLMQRRNDPGRVNEAISHLEQAVKLVRTFPSTYYQLGLAYGYVGRNQEAVWALRHAIDLDPGDGKPYQPLASALQKVGDRDGAARVLQLVRKYQAYAQTCETLRARVRRNPRDLEARRAVAAFYEHSQAWADARGAYQAILELVPNDRDARARLEKLQLLLGQELGDLPTTSPVLSGHDRAAYSR
jgi:tetratricopeptide (TPR) repeat protein